MQEVDGNVGNSEKVILPDFLIGGIRQVSSIRNMLIGIGHFNPFE